jgi:hypothetical protein
MKTPCSKSGCAGRGRIEGDSCPGSDDDSELGKHHCTHCGELEWDNTGSYCNMCGAYWCDDYQNAFVHMDCESITENYKLICFDCFISNQKFWCKDDVCSCSCKIEEVNQTYQQFIAHGIWCGRVELTKGDDHRRIDLYRWQHIPTIRMKFRPTKWKNEVLDFNMLEEALVITNALINDSVAEGFTKDSWGDLE